MRATAPMISKQKENRTAKNNNQDGGSSTSLLKAPILISDAYVYGEKEVSVGQALPSPMIAIINCFSV